LVLPVFCCVDYERDSNDALLDHGPSEGWHMKEMIRMIMIPALSSKD
jgi:hypothetical protein